MARDIHALISQMTLEEKASLCSGSDFWHTQPIERLGIPAVMFADGPHGLRKQGDGRDDHLGLNESIEAVCFPAACALASSFDPELAKKLGSTLGQECQAEGLGVLLGPAVNIKRSPLCGRNFEYLSEDPFLTGKIAAAYIDGVQSWDVGTSIKHFAANNQEYRRMNCSSEVDERTLREIYLPAFEEAVKASQPQTIMCSYNKINGVYSADNEWLLSKVLREEWGFEGYVVTDWGAVNNRVQGVRAGLDLEMPSSGGVNDAKIVAAIKNGTLDEALLDQTVERILKVVFSYVDHRHPEATFDRDADHEKAVEMETECAVLLENNGALPLKAGAKVAYIGGFALTPRYQGGGSSHINASKVISALQSAQVKRRNVIYTEGFPSDRDEIDPDAFCAAVDAAREAEAAVVFAGLPDIVEGESYDRVNMKLPACQDRLIAAIAAVQPNTIVVLHNGSPVECPWAEDVAAVLEMYLGGQGVGEACDRLLWGEANPCGRLAETFPLRVEDNPSFLNFPGDGKKVKYAEGVFIGYRYYDTKKMPVRWAFGHGLSYTQFEYRDLWLSSDKMDDEGTVQVNVVVSNTGPIDGKEVVQLYISDKTGCTSRPTKELKGFAKVALRSGETKTVTLEITARDLSWYNEDIDDWYAASGKYEVLVGHASDDIQLSGELQFTTNKIPPMIIDGSTTLSELMDNPKTAAALSQILRTTFGSAATENATSTESKDATEQATIFAMPLKTLANFAAMGEEQYQEMLNGLRSALHQGSINH
ncbi:glycoside hydrolase family 3 C-terminal domain-containing protein [Schaalia sp. ZJ405]|uniref:glycoside hydrolase family 3 C-terminal domain-containing protein n=1 Tax=Schaalia sp. ZJ405 TaxID=2709403 RepID=UPI0013E9EA0C|nr:glycoside hydrolase family 3 C-terminal domain-containing protein [Schaalia sp. ZJ405]QPK81647.1 glycoside hydrolase family 3 C-terminal domain-containing protein [Schaalia sp. ZJ405]